jgi:hypothetical protein
MQQCGALSKSETCFANPAQAQLLAVAGGEKIPPRIFAAADLAASRKWD